MNTKFILKTGEFIYPAYLDKTHRLELKNKFGNGYGYMRCGCRPDENLFYRISEDGKIYPDFNEYVKAVWCPDFEFSYDYEQTYGIFEEYIDYFKEN